MEEEVRKDIIEVLQEAANLVLHVDAQRLKQISDHTLHNSATYQDEDSILIAILIYTLGKISEKENNEPSFKIFAQDISKHLELAGSSLQKNDAGSYQYHIRESFEVIKKLVDNIGVMASEVLHHSRIKKASRIFEHGISMGRVSNLLGISKWEIMDYIGHSHIHDVSEIKTKSAKERLGYVQKIFGVQK